MDTLRLTMEGVSRIFPKILRGLCCLDKILTRVHYLFCVFMHFYEQVQWKFSWGQVLCYTPLTLRVYLRNTFAVNWWNQEYLKKWVITNKQSFIFFSFFALFNRCIQKHRMQKHKLGDYWTKVLNNTNNLC